MNSTKKTIAKWSQIKHIKKNKANEYVYCVLDTNTGKYLYKPGYKRAYNEYKWEDRRRYNWNTLGAAASVVRRLTTHMPHLIEGRNIIIALYKYAPAGEYVAWENYKETIAEEGDFYDEEDVDATGSDAVDWLSDEPEDESY